MKTNTPTQKQFQVVIDNLKKASKSAKKDENRNVNMMETSINYCGSPMCFAGWYAVAKKLDEWENSYSDGAQAVAVDLGFDGKLELCIWAETNITIWGNRWGNELFWDGRAFGMYEDYGTLQQIIDHLIGVKERAGNEN